MTVPGPSAAFLARNPRAGRAAGWALLGAPPLLAWWAMEWLNSKGLFTEISWTVGPILVSNVFLTLGLVYTGALGIALWRGGQAGPRAAGFAVLAMPCLALGANAGLVVFGSASDLPEFAGGFLVWFAALLAAGLWVTLAGVLALPALRSRRAAAWLPAASAAIAALAGAGAIAEFWAMLEAMLYVIAAWGAAYAAALAMALPPRAGDGDTDAP